MADNNDNNLDARVTSLERQVAVVAAKVDAVISELQDFKNEMRASRARQDEDIREIRARQDADMKEIRSRQDADMKEIREILNNNVRNMFITVIIGVGAMVVAVLMR